MPASYERRGPPPEPAPAMGPGPAVYGPARAPEGTPAAGPRGRWARGGSDSEDEAGSAGSSSSGASEGSTEELERIDRHRALLAARRRMLRLQYAQQQAVLADARRRREAQHALREEMAGLKARLHEAQERDRAAAGGAAAASRRAEAAAEAMCREMLAASFFGSEEEARLWGAHERAWRAFEREPPAVIRLRNIPWPPEGAGNILKKMASTRLAEAEAEAEGGGGGGPGGEPALDFKGVYRTASLRWHPDKFLHKFGGRVDLAELDAVCARVQGVAQTVNHAWDELRQRAADPPA